MRWTRIPHCLSLHSCRSALLCFTTNRNVIHLLATIINLSSMYNLEAQQSSSASSSCFLPSYLISIQFWDFLSFVLAILLSAIGSFFLSTRRRTYLSRVLFSGKPSIYSAKTWPLTDTHMCRSVLRLCAFSTRIAVFPFPVASSMTTS